ncbi:MAG: transposase [Alphaproteobacteria bacterium]|nr:transposase [Alphaproteobacteria bacterium]
MNLWKKWWEIVLTLRSTCTRFRSFMWLAVALIGFTIRSENSGVTSIVRALGLRGHNYDRLLDFFHSPALSVEKLTQQWVKIVIEKLPLLKRNGRLILVGDGLKVAKAGKKMPAVKKMFQESESNTKPSYIFGHSYQSIGILAGSESTVFAVPLISRIHEGLQFTNRDKRTLLDKMVELLLSITTDFSYYLIADAYYSCRSMIHGVLNNGNHLISRVKSNAVAFEEAPQNNGIKKRGRKKKYGNKIKLTSLVDKEEKMEELASPIAGDNNVNIKYIVKTLFWRRAGVKVKFVIALHPTKGQIILMSTDLSQSAVEIIELYSLRFKIELSFKQAVREVGAYSYHFWMKGMQRINRKGKKQHMHKKSEEYRKAVRRKMDSYHRFVQVGIIAQGLLQYLSCCHTKLVWKHFGSWIRTKREGVLPSEMVTSIAMRNSFSKFLVGCGHDVNITKFIIERIDIERTEGARLVA